MIFSPSLPLFFLRKLYISVRYLDFALFRTASQVLFGYIKPNLEWKLREVFFAVGEERLL